MIVLRSVSKIYGRWRRRKNVLINANAVFEAKGNYVILGMPKSGKTTLLNLLCGMTTPTRGTLTRYGRVGFPIGFAAVGQPRFTGRELAVLLANLYEADADEIIEFTTSFSELGPDMKRPISSLEDPLLKARLYVTLGYALPLDFYLFDGTIGRAGEGFREKCQAAFDARRAEAGTIFVTNDYRNAKLYGSRGGVLHDGRLELFDTVDEALDKFQAIRRAAEHGTLGYARDLVRTGESAEARAYLRQYLAVQRDAAAYELLLGLAMRVVDYREAKAVCRAALRDFPNAITFHNALATIAERQGDHAEAAGHAQAALKIDSTNHHAQMLLAKAYEALGRDSDAAALWNDVADRHNDLKISLRAIRANAKAGNWDLVMSRIDKAAASFGPAADVALTDLRIRALLETGRLGDAENALVALGERDLEKALSVVNLLAAEADPSTIEPLLRQLHLKFDLAKSTTRNMRLLSLIDRQLATNHPNGDGAAASALLSQIRNPTRQSADAAAPHLSLAIAAERQGNHAEVVSHAQAALKIDPANPQAQTLLAKAYEASGLDNEAAAAWSNIADRHEDLRTWLTAIRANAKAGNWQQVATRVDMAAAKFGAAADAALTDLRVRALLETGRFGDAEDALLTLGERDLEKALSVVNLLAAEVDPSKIVPLVRQLHLKFDLTRNTTRNMRFMLNLIERHLATKRLGADGAAISEVFRQIRNPTGQSSDAAAPHVALATTAARHGNHDEAISHARAALKIDPANSQAQTLLAKAYEARGLDNEAAAAWSDIADRRKDLRTWLTAIRANAKVGNWQQVMSRIDKAVAIFGPAAETVLTDLRIRAMFGTGHLSEVEDAVLALAERDLEKALSVVNLLAAEAAPSTIVHLVNRLHLKFDLNRSMNRNLRFMLNLIERHLAVNRLDGGSAALSEVFGRFRNPSKQSSDTTTP
jgi:capsular polysaccharide transport system ATP-binding protein